MAESQEIEWHDSEICGACHVAGELHVLICAYVHKSGGKPGVDPGTGWWQAVLLTVTTDDPGQESLDELVEIAGGCVKTQSATIEHMIPLPWMSQASTTVTLQLKDGRTWQVSGKSASISVIGGPEYVEAFSGSNLP